MVTYLIASLLLNLTASDVDDAVDVDVDFVADACGSYCGDVAEVVAVAGDDDVAGTMLTMLAKVLVTATRTWNVLIVVVALGKTVTMATKAIDVDVAGVVVDIVAEDVAAVAVAYTSPLRDSDLATNHRMNQQHQNPKQMMIAFDVALPLNVARSSRKYHETRILVDQ